MAVSRSERANSGPIMSLFLLSTFTDSSLSCPSFRSPFVVLPFDCLRSTSKFSTTGLPGQGVLIGLPPLSLAALSALHYHVGTVT